MSVYTRQYSALIAVVLLGTFVAFSHFAVNTTLLDGLNQAVADHAASLRTDSLTSFFAFVTKGADFWYAIGAIVAAMLYLHFIVHSWRSARTVLITAVVTNGLVTWLKEFTALERPSGGLIEAALNSYPSGHTAAAVAIYGVIAIAISHSTNTTMARLILLAWVVIAALISYSRIYLGVHFASDVIGGILLALLLLHIAHVSPFGLRPKYKERDTR